MTFSRPNMKSLRVLCIALFLFKPAQAALVEEVIQVPVTVSAAQSEAWTPRMTVTVFRDDSRVNAPYLVLHHGRPTTAGAQAAMGRQRFVNSAKYFVGLGFVVLVPTRVGYGETGGPDLEDAGPCQNRRYGSVFETGVDQTASLLFAAQRLSYVDLSRGIIVGQSVGGMVAIAAASRPLTGLLATVNFAGGHGGNPRTRPGDPCAEPQLRETFRAYGASSRVPTLWLYSENDRFWGPKLPRLWFEAYVDAGGRAEFVSLPAIGEDGHASFMMNRPAWREVFESFLLRAGVFEGAFFLVPDPLSAPVRP